MGLLCRKICEPDLDAVADLLVRGFPIHRKSYWTAGLARLSDRAPIDEYPRYGYLIESDDAVVGVVLTIFSERRIDGGTQVRCNMSSWHVAPNFQGYAPLMVSAALRHKEVTYVNVSPAPHTLPIIEAQGFRRFCDGQVICVPAFNKFVKGARIYDFDLTRGHTKALTADERELIAEHVKQGCVALNCVFEGRVYPFVFIPRTRLRGKIPCLHLAFCRRVEDFVNFAGPLGRALLRRRHGLIIVDSNAPIPGLAGRYFADLGPKYFRGPTAPALGDLSYTEGVYFH